MPFHLLEVDTDYLTSTKTRIPPNLGTIFAKAHSYFEAYCEKYQLIDKKNKKYINYRPDICFKRKDTGEKILFEIKNITKNLFPGGNGSIDIFNLIDLLTGSGGIL